ncbi:MAG TPA: hypothetical protein VGH97_12240 [Thermoanaerobaculia bacterium]|jgi:hypothetical protein
MKAYLWLTGAIFALFAAMHAYITWEHARKPAATLWDWLGPLLVGAVGAVLAVWAFRLIRSTRGSRAA